MNIRKQHEREIQYDEDGNPFVIWGKATKIPISEFYRESVRFVDWERKYWHAMDCTRDLVIHLNKEGDHYILGKVSA
jgi:hypothetical protein